MRAMTGKPALVPTLIHTGQHYDQAMSARFFQDLQIRPPDINLEVGSGSHALQTAHVMQRLDPILEALRPDLVLVVGDVNSTVAAAITAVKRSITVAHVEAGLRSFDRSMPEEINRILTDAVADLLFVTEESARVNLLREGVDPVRIHFVGNVMIDALESSRRQWECSSIFDMLGVEPGATYAVLTLHRPSNVDDEGTLGNLMRQMLAISSRLPLLFSVHPRTRKKLEEFKLWPALQSASGIKLTEPLGYVEFMALVKAARAVVTDSGGVQEESTYLGIPCLTLRENTERPITVTQGSNRLVAADELSQKLDIVLSGQWPQGSRPDRWDGQAAQRCVAALQRRHESKRIS